MRGPQHERRWPGWMIWQIRESKPLGREQNPLKNSPSPQRGVSSWCVRRGRSAFSWCFRRGLFWYFSQSMSQTRGLPKSHAKALLSVVCAHNNTAHEQMLSQRWDIGGAVGCCVQLCGSSVSPLLSLWSLIINCIADGIANCQACKFGQINGKGLLLLLCDRQNLFLAI